MSLETLKELESSLWEAADQLRANSKLNATEYSMPVLGLIFLRHATNRFESAKKDIEASLPTRGGKTREITPADFKGRAALFIPEKARYDYLATLTESEDLGKAINDAMDLIEDESEEQLGGVLPKRYHIFEPRVLWDLLRIFNSEALQVAEGDVFGRIYEYFLNAFASSVAGDEGQFFTPPSLVRLIVNVIEPNHGKVMDPAVGSAGMLVQSAHFMEALEKSPGEVATFIGRDKSTATVKLAKMNVAVHGFGADIQEGNTFYDRAEQYIGQCDFIMANPPFNVDGVDPARIDGDPRLFTEKKVPGVTKGKKGAGGGKPPGVSNANYLWIQYFHAYLNDTGRAGFVMAASATDAGHGEKDIRKEIVETGDVDAIIRIGEKFFYTRTLPCTLWFFDKGKPIERKDKVLMLDARNIHRVVSRRVHDFSDEQLANLTAIVWLYRGQGERYLSLVRAYLEGVGDAAAALEEGISPLDAPLGELTQAFSDWAQTVKDVDDADPKVIATYESALKERTDAIGALGASREAEIASLKSWSRWLGDAAPTLGTNQTQKEAYDRLSESLPRLKALQRQVGEVLKLTHRALDIAEKEMGARSHRSWNSRTIRGHRRDLDEARQGAAAAIKAVTYLAAQVHWLQSRFPEATFTPVPGLCKVVDRGEIKDQDYSLTPGRFVGVAPPELEDEEDFEERIRAIHTELLGLNEEAAELAQTIAANFEELVG